jgi:hypothetical protein
VWDSYYYECPGCGGRFRWQVDPTSKHRSYVMRVGVRGEVGSTGSVTESSFYPYIVELARNTAQFTQLVAFTD